MADKFDAATPEARVSKSEVKNGPAILMTAACFGFCSEVGSKSRLLFDIPPCRIGCLPAIPRLSVPFHLSPHNCPRRLVERK